MNIRNIALVLLLLLIIVSGVIAQGKVRIVVSVDWEGRDLNPKNLQAMQEFRRDYPDIPLQHFLNAAYYTKSQADAVEITKTINSVLLPKDEHGLHIHAWKTLVESAGVTFRSTPSFVRDGSFISDCAIDCGQEIALTGYTNAELRKIIAYSIGILQREKFSRPKSFRAGGWQADDNVLDALAAEGFTLDSSATYADFLKPSWEKYNLYGFVGKLWIEIKPTSQPYVYKTSAGRKILELPNNSCLSDYMTGDAMFKVFELNVNEWQKNPKKNVYLSIGFHQETAARYLPNLREALKLIRGYSQSKNVPIEFIVAPLEAESGK